MISCKGKNTCALLLVSLLGISCLSLAKTKRHNEVYFNNDSINGGKTLNFTYDDQYEVTLGQPWSPMEIDQNFTKPGTTKMVIFAGREGNENIASHFNAAVSSIDENGHYKNDPGKEFVSVSLGNDGTPGKLNFYVKTRVELFTEGEPYNCGNMYIGQGHFEYRNMLETIYDYTNDDIFESDHIHRHNNWWIASPNLTRSTDTDSSGHQYATLKCYSQPSPEAPSGKTGVVEFHSVPASIFNPSEFSSRSTNSFSYR